MKVHRRKQPPLRRSSATMRDATTIDGHAADHETLQIPSNTEGHFILIALNLTTPPPIIRNQDERKTVHRFIVRRTKITRAIAVAGIPLCLAVILQAVISYELYMYTETQCRLDLPSTPNFHMPYLQVCCLLLWWTDMSTELHSIVTNSRIVLANRYHRDNGTRWKLHIVLWRRLVILLVSVVTELLIWAFVMLVGTKFIILCAFDVETLVMNCLAVKVDFLSVVLFVTFITFITFIILQTNACHN